MATVRGSILSGLPQMVRELVRLAEQAIRNDGGIPPMSCAALGAWLASPIQLDTAQNRFIAYRILLGVPWPHFATQPDPNSEWQAAAGLGTIFDALSTRPCHGRRWAQFWLDWSEAAVRDIAQTWRRVHWVAPRPVAPQPSP